MTAVATAVPSTTLRFAESLTQASSSINDETLEPLQSALHKPKFKTMMGEVPVKRSADSDLEAVLSKLSLKDRSRRVLLRSGLDLPDFLALAPEDFERLGLSGEESGYLESVIVEMHKEPWTVESLGTMVPGFPSAAGEKENVSPSGRWKRPRFSALDLSSQLVNVGLHLQCIHSQLLTAERLLKAYTPQELATFGFQESDNCGMLVRGTETVLDQCKSVSAQLKLLQSRIQRERVLLRERGVVPVATRVAKVSGVLILVAGLSGAVYLVYRRLRD